MVDFNLDAEEVARRLHCRLWSLLGTKSRSHGKPCKSQYHLQSTPFHFTLFLVGPIKYKGYYFIFFLSILCLQKLK